MGTLNMILLPAMGMSIITGDIIFATTALDLTKIDNRKQIIEERKGIDCSGIFKQTQLKFDATFKILQKLEVSTGISHTDLVNMTSAVTALGQKRREFCEYYRKTPEWNTEEYFAAYGQMAKQESDIDKMLGALAKEADSAHGGNAKEADKKEKKIYVYEAWKPQKDKSKEQVITNRFLSDTKFDTITLSPGSDFGAAVSQLKHVVETTPTVPDTMVSQREKTPSYSPHHFLSLSSYSSWIVGFLLLVAGGGLVSLYNFLFRKG